MGDLRWQTPLQAAKLIFTGATVLATWRIALVVGTILSVVNQLGPMMDDPDSWLTWTRVAFNYLVPFVVASVGYLTAYRQTVET